MPTRSAGLYSSDTRKRTLIGQRRPCPSLIINPSPRCPLSKTCHVCQHRSNATTPRQQRHRKPKALPSVASTSGDTGSSRRGQTFFSFFHSNKPEEEKRDNLVRDKQMFFVLNMLLQKSEFASYYICKKIYIRFYNNNLALWQQV